MNGCAFSSKSFWIGCLAILSVGASITIIILTIAVLASIYLF